MRYQFLKIAFTVLFKLIAKIDVIGVENVPPHGPFLMAVNHLALIDTPILLVAMPIQKINAFAAYKWKDNFIVGGILKSAANTIFVHRGEIDRAALKAAIAVLKQGEILGIAPEGTRSDTGVLMKAKPGIAYLATKANVPILPVGISGQQNFVDKLFHFKRLRIRMNIGQLIYLPSPTGSDKMAQLQACADQVMVAIAKLIDPELRGVYAAAVDGATHQNL